MVSNIHTDHAAGFYQLFNALVTPELRWVSLYWVFGVTCIFMMIVIGMISISKS